MKKKQKRNLRPPGIPTSLAWPPPRDQGGMVFKKWLREYYTTLHWEGVSKRKRTLKSWCESCKRSPSTVVHHLHYCTLGYEKMGELKAWCVPCHDNHHRRESL